MSVRRLLPDGQRSRIHGRSIGAALLVALAASVPSGWPLPQQPAPTPPPTVFGTEVVLVALPVFVTDGSGKSVPGLTAADFEVEDGGRPVPIRAFQAVDVREPLPESVELPTPVRAALPRQFLLLFDLQFSPFIGIQKARAPAARFVREALAPGDLVAVATYGRRGFKMLSNFTTDHEYVARGIEGLGHDPGQTLADALSLTAELPPVAAGAGENSDLVDQEIEAEMAELTNAARVAYGAQYLDFTRTLEELVQAMSRLSGRKQVILLSAGANESAWRGQASAGPGSLSAANVSMHTAADAMTRLFRSAGQSDVAIHAVNLAGIEAAIDVAGAFAGQGGGARRTGYDTLAALAENTGGRFVLPTNDFGRALGEVERASRQYYVLAFEPANPAGKADKPRSLKVRVRAPGLTLSHRTAYVLKPKTASEPADVRLAAAEAIAKGLTGGAIGLEVVAVPYREKDGATTVPAVVHVDGKTLLAAARGSRLDVEVFGYAVARDRVLDTLAAKTSIDVDKRRASLQSHGLSVVTSFAVPPGSVDLRFFVKAGDAPRTGSISHPVELPAPGAGELVVSAPVVAAPLEGRLAFPAATRARPGIATPFMLGREIFLPAAPALEPGRARELLVFAWRKGGRAGTPLDVTGEIARPGQAPLPLRIGPVRVVPGADGVDRCLVTVEPPETDAGDYSLRLAFREPGTAESARAETTLRLRR
jgi:VWFA-related protein